MDVLEYTTRLWKKLGKLYTKYKKEGKKIFCYIEDYNGDINECI